MIHTIDFSNMVFQKPKTENLKLRGVCLMIFSVRFFTHQNLDMRPCRKRDLSEDYSQSLILNIRENGVVGMGRIRYLKPDFFKDEDLVEHPFWIRLLFQGLWTIADKEGRLEDRPKRIKADLFPYENVDVEEGLSELSKIKNHSTRPFIQRYEANGEAYIQIVNWHKHQKPHHTEKESLIPPAPPITNGMGKGKQDGASVELKNGELTVKKPLKPSKEDFLTSIKANPAYRHINIENELAKMDAWLLTHKGRQKTPRFVVNWLNKIEKPLDPAPTKLSQGEDTLAKYKLMMAEAA